MEKCELLNKGCELLKQKRYPDAALVFNEIIEAGSYDQEIEAAAFFNLGNLFQMTGEIGKAIKAFNKVLQYEPTNTDAAISLSVLYNDIGQYENAKRIFNLASERVKSQKNSGSIVEDKHINKKFSIKHLELADLYMTYGRHDEALFEYNKVVSLDPEHLDARVRIAKVYSKKNFKTKALDELKNLKNEHPSFLPGRIALGVFHFGNGNVLEAQAEWNKVLAMDPFNNEAKTYLNLSKTASETCL